MQNMLLYIVNRTSLNCPFCQPFPTYDLREMRYCNLDPIKQQTARSPSASRGGCDRPEVK